MTSTDLLMFGYAVCLQPGAEVATSQSEIFWQFNQSLLVWFIYVLILQTVDIPATRKSTPFSA